MIRSGTITRTDLDGMIVTISEIGRGIEGRSSLKAIVPREGEIGVEVGTSTEIGTGLGRKDAKKKNGGESKSGGLVGWFSN